jgi:hypothetical protein
VHTCSPRTEEAKAEELQVQDKAGLQSEFQVNLCCLMRPCLKKKKLCVCVCVCVCVYIDLSEDSEIYHGLPLPLIPTFQLVTGPVKTLIDLPLLPNIPIHILWQLCCMLPIL